MVTDPRSLAPSCSSPSVDVRALAGRVRMAETTAWDATRLLQTPPNPRLSYACVLPTSRHRVLQHSGAEHCGYRVHSVSGYHASFHPSHILVDKPTDDSSRWTAPSPEDRRQQARRASGVGTGPSSAGTSPTRRREPEWIIVELEQVAILRTVGFGKTTKRASSSPDGTVGEEVDSRRSSCSRLTSLNTLSQPTPAISPTLRSGAV